MNSTIINAIPHRFPFLFVDEILKMDEKTIQTSLFLSPDWDCFKGHYPGFPVFPGVLSCEAILQSGAILVSKRLKQESLEDQVPVVTRMNQIKFKQVLFPKDQIQIFVQLTEFLAGVFYMKGRIERSEQLAVSLEFSSTLIAKNRLCPS